VAGHSIEIPIQNTVCLICEARHKFLEELETQRSFRFAQVRLSRPRVVRFSSFPLSSSAAANCPETSPRGGAQARSRSKHHPPSPPEPGKRAAAMWVEILCGLVAYKVIRHFFFDGGDDASYLADLDSSHSDLCFAVAARWVPPQFFPFLSSIPPLNNQIKRRETLLTPSSVPIPFQAREALRRPMLRRPPHPRPRRRRAPAHRCRPRHQEVSLSATSNLMVLNSGL